MRRLFIGLLIIGLFVLPRPASALEARGAASGSGGPPTGAAGGDLGGTYPNPSVVQVNGAAVPTSAPLVGTNGSNQIVLATPFSPNPKTATYQVLASDFSGYKIINVASGTFTITLVASGSQPPTGQSVLILNFGSGVVTIARSGQNINGGTASLTLPAGSATAPSDALVVSDGTNYFGTVHSGSSGTVTNIATTSPITGGPITATGTIACATCATTTNGGALSGTAPIAVSAAGAISITSPLPIANGGTNTASTLTGIVRGGASYTAAELSGDVTTSGSNAATVVQVNGAAMPASAPLVGTNSSKQVVLATPFAPNPQTATYQALASDFSNYKTIVAASGTFTITLVASGSQPPTGQSITVINYGSGVVTVARSGQNINGGTGSLVLPAASATAPSSVQIVSDGTNYFGSVNAGPTVGSSTSSTGQFTNVAVGASVPALDATTGDITATGAVKTGASPPTVTAGTAGLFACGEGTLPTSLAGADIITCNSATHRATQCNNGVACTQIVASGADINASDQVTGTNGGTIPASAPIVGTNSNSQIVLATPFATNAQTGTYQVLASDFSNYKTIIVASGTFTITLVASGSQPPTGQFIHVVNYGSGAVTIARSGQNINGQTTSLLIPATGALSPKDVTVVSDGTNYFATFNAASTGEISAGPNTFGNNTTWPTNSPIMSSIPPSYSTGATCHFTKLSCVNTFHAATCTTAPIINIFQTSVSNLGSTVTCDNTLDSTLGTFANTSQTLVFTPPVAVGIFISTQGATCLTDQFNITADYKCP